MQKWYKELWDLFNLIFEPVDASLGINTFSKVFNMVPNKSFDGIFVHVILFGHCNKSNTSIMAFMFRVQ